MRGSWLDSVSAGALLALTIAVSGVPLPAAAQQAATQQTAAIESAIPVPEPANVPPPTIADLEPPSATASITPTSAAAPETQGETPAAAPASEAAAAPPASIPAPTVTATVTPAPSAAPVPQVPAPQANERDIERGVPIPEPANVPPPTRTDIGAIPASAADMAVAAQLREFIATRAERFIEGKKERTALTDFYKARNYAPMWIENGAPNDRMKAAIARLKASDADGLDANDYATPDLKSLTADPDSLAQAELKLTNSLLTFARHAQSGRVVANRISTNIEYTQPIPEPADILATLAEAKDTKAALDGFNPPHQGFKRLKAKLAELRGSADDKTVEIPKGPTLHPPGKAGKKKGAKPVAAKNDPRVPLLRERLKVGGDPSDTTYEGAVVDAVREFQRSKGMAANGVLNEATVNALNGRSRSRDINTIISNMERWRWLPRELGQAYVMVNLPDFTLKVVKNDNEVLFHTRIVIGKQNTPSPVFSDEIENIQVNPTWHVPQSIIYGEYLPALQQDPSVLARMGLVMERNRDGSVSIRQPPGERNALGRIKFNFPNRFQVYLHDTPQKHLFAHDRRAYSHGCMRVQNPDKFGEVLASIAIPQDGYTAQRFTRMYGSGEQWIKFRRFIPVHLVYMNAYVEADGKLVVRDDIYGYDHRVQSALNGKYIVVAERSQRVTPGAVPKGTRRMVEQQPQQQRGFFLFPFFR
jgi:murein L,D-transpeptidase YcbB/YkuD